MPWKIHPKETNLTGEAPRLVMWDASVDLYLVTEMNTGVIDVFIGTDRPRFANIHVTIDSERVPAIQLEHAIKCTERQCAVISSVLATMGVDDHPRHTILEKAKAIWQERGEAFKLAGVFPTREERSQHHRAAEKRRLPPRE